MTIEKIVCDRCGAEVIYPTKRILFLSGIGREGGFDLCDNCHKELNVWFNDKKGALPSVTPTSDAEDKYDIGYNCGYADAMSDIAESEG